jgi:hypothetical protein
MIESCSRREGKEAAAKQKLRLADGGVVGGNPASDGAMAGAPAAAGIP